MELMLDERDAFRDEKGIILRLCSVSGLEEDDHSGLTGSDLKIEFEKIAIHNYINFVSVTKNFSEEFIASDSMNIFSRIASLYNIHVNLWSSELYLERSKHHRRTRSINDLGSFILECRPPVVGSGNLIISPSGKWILDSIGEAFLKRSLFFPLGVVNGAVSQVVVKSVNNRQAKTSKLTCSPSGHFNSSSALQKSKGDIILFRKQLSEMMISCSSTNSTTSYETTSSSSSSFTKGMLRCIRKSGRPYFVFSLDDALGNVYITSPQKIEPSVDKTPDYVYFFYSVKASKKDPNYGNNKTNFVGKMRVSSSLVLNLNMSKVVETEFVLVSASEDHSMEIQSSSSSITKSNCLSKKVAEIFKPSHSFKHKPTPEIGRIGESSAQSDESELEQFLCELCDFNELGSVSHIDDDFPPSLELAAIVVKDYQHNGNEDPAVGGWGLKFLEKARDAKISHEPLFSSGIHKERSCVNESECARSMNVLVPAGTHGGPSTRTGGPSSLTDRWQSGGYCDCGGWDVGCPLTVLKDTSNYSRASSEENSQNDSKSVTLIIEGAKASEPALRMVSTNGDLYCVYFQSTLSALQSFSIAVAFIHTQTPTLYPKF